MFDSFPEVKEKSVRDIPITPILDMLVAIIFFLLLSTTFYNLTKQHIPPSQTVTITNPLTPPPVSPRLLISQRANSLHIILRWSGKSPGQIQKRIPLTDASAYTPRLWEEVNVITERFKFRYPNETSVQISLAPKIPYQVLVTTIDAIQSLLPDIVLLSYKEASQLMGADNV